MGLHSDDVPIAVAESLQKQTEFRESPIPRLCLDWREHVHRRKYRVRLPTLKNLLRNSLLRPPEIHPQAAGICQQV